MLRGAARYLYLAIGLLFVGLGVLGAVLPVLPTTPFLLISLWAFSKSSRRLELWLLHHPRFGPRLRAWRSHRVVPWPVKLTAWTSMAVSLTIMILGGASGVAIAGSAAVMAIAVVYVARCPSHPPPPVADAPSVAEPLGAPALAAASPPPHRADADVKQP